MELASRDAVGILAIIMPFVALLLGYFSERTALGAIMLGAYTALAGGLCFVGLELGGGAGLLSAIILTTVLAHRLGKGIGKRRGALFVPSLWLGFCGSCMIGYVAGGLLGLLTITLPSIIVFWGGLFMISHHLLPLHYGNEVPKAFRSLITFALGTNFPYHVLQGRELDQRVDGNPYGQFFAGPGIVLTGPAHAPIIWDGVAFKRVGEPGLAFTHRFETVFAIVDLRPQFRSFYAEAATKDGIRIRSLIAICFRLSNGGQEPQIGGSFPVDQESVYAAVWSGPAASGERQGVWDDRVPVEVVRVWRELIRQYRENELQTSYDPTSALHAEIRQEFTKLLREELEGMGIELIDSWMCGVEPVQNIIIRKRVEVWWDSVAAHVQTTDGERSSGTVWELEQAYFQAQRSLLSVFQSTAEQHNGQAANFVAGVAVLKFVDAVESMAADLQAPEVLPSDTGRILGHLRRALRSSEPMTKARLESD